MCISTQAKRSSNEYEKTYPKQVLKLLDEEAHQAGPYGGVLWLAWRHHRTGHGGRDRVRRERVRRRRVRASHMR